MEKNLSFKKKNLRIVVFFSENERYFAMINHLYYNSNSNYNSKIRK